MSSHQLVVFVCTGPICGEAGKALARATRARVVGRGWQELVSVQQEICLGYCHQGPNVMLCTQGVPWGRAPLAGSPGTQTLHRVDEAALVLRLEAQLGEGKDVRTPPDGAKG